jgi:uncharacterized protein YndB with AHSA1/START domain
MSQKHTSVVTLPNDFEVVVVRKFAAPRTLVFEAITTPRLLQRWMLGPPGWEMPVCEMDLRVGGAYRWRWRDAQGAEFGFSGEFREIVPPARIVHVERFDPGNVGGDMVGGESGEAVVTTELAEQAGVTIQTMTIRYSSKEIRDAALKTGMTDGMEMSYAKLDALLEEQAAH